MATPTPGTGRRWTSHRRRWMVGVVVGALAVSGTLQTTGAGAADTAASTATTLTEAHLTLSVWKHHYESAVGVIVGDIFIVVATGEKESKNPTKKSEEAALSHCQKWLDNAKKIPNEVPKIPVPSAQENWHDLIQTSIVASSACVAAISRGSTSAAHKFLAILSQAESYGHRLIRQLKSPKG